MKLIISSRAGVDGSRTHRSRINRLPTILKTVESTGTQLPPGQIGMRIAGLRIAHSSFTMHYSAFGNLS